MSVPAIQINDVSKNFGGNFAARNINLQIEEGEFFSFLGPSGCGKTTLLRMIAGFETPTSGTILIAGKDVVGVPPHKRSVNMVFQNYALFPHLTVGENVAFGLKSTKQFDRAEIASRVTSALQLVRLEQFLERMPSQLSGGQQQRVALARALVNKPAVLLLDEPLSALDPQIREEMQIELSQLQKRLNMTFIMVTHDQAECLALSTRVAVFCQGNLEQVGRPEEIYDQPRTPFVAKFIGQTNLFDGEIVKDLGDKYLVKVAENLDLSVTKLAGHVFNHTDRVQLWIKPHVLEMVNDFDDVTQFDTVMTCRVVHRNYQGTSTEYFVELCDDPKFQLRVSQTNYAGAELNSAAGNDVVRVAVPRGAISIMSDERATAAPVAALDKMPSSSPS